jgi:transporter family protein
VVDAGFRCLNKSREKRQREELSEIKIDTRGEVDFDVTMNWFFWALLSAFFAGITAILAKIGVAGVNPNLAVAIRTTVVLVFAWSIAFATVSTSSIASLSRRVWLFLILSGLATGASWFCYFRALQIGQASLVAPVDKLSVVFAIALAAIILHEQLTWHQWVGGSLVVAGALVLAWR